LSQTDKRESSISVLQSSTLKQNTFPPRYYAMAQPPSIKYVHKSKYFLDIILIRQVWNLKYFKIHVSAPNCPPHTFCWRCSCIILFWLKNSWNHVHELLHWPSMFLDIFFTYPTDILYQVSFPLYQILKIRLPSGLLANLSIHNLLYLQLLCYKDLFFPLNILSIFWLFSSIFPVRILICNIEYGWYSHILWQLYFISILTKSSQDFAWSYLLQL
jgi:hypothetical protein